MSSFGHGEMSAQFHPGVALQDGGHRRGALPVGWHPLRPTVHNLDSSSFSCSQTHGASPNLTPRFGVLHGILQMDSS